MITVYGYGFEEPRPPEPPPTPWGTYAVLALAAWWAWKKWGKAGRVSNPRRRHQVRRQVRRRRNPRVRFRVGDHVSVPWFPQRKGHNRVRAKVLQIIGGRAIVQFPKGNLHNVSTSGLRRVK